MKKKSSSKSAFFNFRVLLFLCAAGALLVLAAFGARPGGSSRPQQSAQDQNGGLAQAQEADNSNLSPSGPGLVPGQRASSSSFTLMEAPGSTGATVTTDKADYAPGETVVISGTGWTANQEVALHIDDSNGVPRWDASVTADGAGNISNSGFIIQAGDVGLAFTLTATQGAVTAWTQFTDVVGPGVAPNGDPGGFEIDPAGVDSLRASTSPVPRTDWLDALSGPNLGIVFDTGVPKDTAVTGRAIDPANCGSACDDAFTGGSGGPNDNPSHTWFWQTGASNAKTDMNNAYFHISTSANGHRWITASGDRFSTNGTAYIDFELLQQTLTRNVQTGCVKPPCGNFTSDAPDSTGGRTVNDLLITAAYGNGGSVATLGVSQWQQVSPGVYQYVDVSSSIPAGSAFVATSLVPVPPGVPVPYGAFGATPGVYSPNQFVEFSIDLTALLNVIGDPCEGIHIKTLMVKTKTSTTVTATLEDMLPPFQVSFGVGLTVTGSKTDPLCPSDTGTVTATWSGGTGPFECKLDDGGTYAPCDSPKSYSVPSGSTHTIFVKDTGNTNCVKDTGPLTVGAGCTTAPTIGSPGASSTVEGCPATFTPSFTAPTASDNCAGGPLTPTNLGDTTSGNNCSKTFTRSWRATDACGNTSGTVSQATTVHDTTAPTISAAGSDATIQCPATPSFTAPTASDACGTSTVNFLGETTTAGTCANNYTAARSWNAVDACGNTSATRTQTITVEDTTAPTISAAGSDATIQCPATPSFTAPTASDACGTSTVNFLGETTTAGTCANNYTAARSWNAVDACGNTSATRTQTITVEDTTAPTISAAGSDATIQCPATPSFTAPTASDACGTSTVNFLGETTTAGTCANNYTAARSWNAVDACGNTSATRTQTITVEDTTAPTISAAGSDATIQCPATPSFTAPTASDACGTSTVNFLGETTTAGTCANNYTAARSWNAVDACGNTSATRTQTITVADTTAPTISAAGSDATIQCPATPSFTAPTASDACGTSTVNFLGETTTAGTCANNYTAARSWNAVDACGNTSATRTQTITVEDTTAPTISAAGSDATIQCPATPSFTAPTASDACGTSTVNFLGETTTAGTCANNYTAARSWNAVDACGNTSATRTQTITVADTTAPTISAAGSDATIQCPATPSFTAPTASDACGTSTVNFLGETTTAGTCANNYTAARSWNAVDACGNTSATRTQTITVADTTAPTISAAGSDATIECPATPSFTAPTASDTCGGSSVVQDSDTTAAGTCAGSYSETRTWHAVDACGNTSASRSQTITVADTTAPTIGNAGANGTIECPATPSFTAPTASDTCGGSSVVQDSDTTAAGTCAGSYSETRTWHAVDACGNTSASRSQTIAVVDTTAPTIGSAGANTTIACDGTPVFTPPTASDACGTATVQQVSDTTTTHGDITIYTRCWNAVDACSNTSATVCQTITRPACQVSQITPTGTTCTQFVNHTAQTLSTLSYKVKNGLVQQVSPGVFFYWVAVTVPTAGNQSFTITQMITTGNFTGLFDVAAGSNVFTSDCNSVHPNITQNPATGAVTATFNAPSPGTYIIGIKYSASSVVGDPAPTGMPPTVHYAFATTGVPGTTQGLDLVRSQ